MTIEELISSIGTMVDADRRDLAPLVNALAPFSTGTPISPGPNFADVADLKRYQWAKMERGHVRLLEIAPEE